REKQKGSRGIRRGQRYRLVFQFPIRERLQSREWFDADAVVISDFIAQRLPDDVTSKVKELQRVHQHRFHAVAMSAHGKPGIMRIFDHIWRFDTGMRSRLLRRWRR
ncbi:hypothetical protein ACD975_09230, partial [Escherichia coli]